MTTAGGPARVLYAVFETAIGPCGIAWTARGVRRLQLPEADASATEARLVRGLGAGAERAVPTGLAGGVVEALARHLAGDAQDLSAVPLDLDASVPAFHRRVYDAARAIPAGHTRTYGELARALGAPGAARAVGQAMARNPVALIVPCHRVLAAGGRAGGFSAYGGLASKARLLAIERGGGRAD